MVLQSDLAAKGEASYGVYEVLWAGRYKHGEHIARYLMQLGEASADEAFRVRYFPLSLTGSAFQWFTSLPPQSVGTWRELEQKFHTHYFSGSIEKKLIDLTTLK
jgi:hypothetical protein